jgi:ArsR family transcriptional regulator
MPAATLPDLARAAALFHALSDETRLAILDRLRAGEQCVCDLMADLDAAQSRLSFHLKVLKEAGLVTDRREGRWSYYAIVPAVIDEAHDLLIERLPHSVHADRTYTPRTAGARRALPIKSSSACC